MTDAPSFEGPPADGVAEVLLTRTAASQALARFGIHMNPATLARAWSTGSGGPPCQHIRRKPYYPKDLLEAWARSQITGVASSARERDLQRRKGARHGQP